MNETKLVPLPLTSDRFTSFGDVIEADDDARQVMNDARFERFNDLSRVDVDGDVSISMVRSRTATRLPYRVDMLERHPLGSQAFIPLSRFEFLVVVAPPGEDVDPQEIRAFIVPPGRGINYHRGTWHMPLIAQEALQEFIVVDRGVGSSNCQELYLDPPCMLMEPDHG